MADRRPADDERRREGQACAREHPSRQRDRRQEAAALRMSVRPDAGLRRLRQEVEPVPERRQLPSRSPNCVSLSSSVAAAACAGAGAMRSSTVSVLPIHSAKGCASLITGSSPSLFVPHRPAPGRLLSPRGGVGGGERVREPPYSSIGPPTMRLSRSLPIAPSLKPSTSASTSSVCSPSTGARRGASRGTDENSSGEPGTR